MENRFIARSLHVAIIGVCACAIFGASLVDSRIAAGQGIAGNLESRVKVAYLYNFIHYVKWPKKAFADKSAPITIGILGNDPFGERINSMARRKMRTGRPIEIRRFASWDDYEPCHLLYVSRSASKKLASQAIAKTKDLPVWLVGEAEGYARQGATMGFYLKPDNTVGFEINLKAVRERQLNVDARLLKLARIVK